MLYEKASEFGYTEVQRQKNSDDSVGPLNQRLNACGASLREFSEMEFPFPNSSLFGTRTQRVGAKRGKFRVAGYEKTSFGPKVILSHPDLPSLDFGDAVRSHNEIIATDCTIRDVSVRETTRYGNLFLLLTRPYLEYIYSEYKCGRSGFRTGVNAALRQVKELIIQAGYQPKMFLDTSVTGTLEYEPGKVSVEFFDSQFVEALRFYGNHPALQELKRLKKKGFVRSPGIVEPCLTKNDVEYIRQQVIRRGRLKGSIMHRRIAHLFPTPWNLRAVIYNDHEFASSSEHIIVSELPLVTDSGTGKVDITLLERVVSKDGKNAFNRPVLACEIKTRMGHQWYLDAELKSSKSRGKKGIPHRVVSNFPINYRFMDNTEWESVVDSMPYDTARKQVSIYADALSTRFQEITDEKSTYVYRSTIIIEAISDINQVRRVIEGLVLKAYEFLKKTNVDVKRMIILPTNVTDCKIALVIHKQRNPNKTSREMVEIPWSPLYNPFQQIQKSDRRFILYLTSESPTSAGTSAAFNARNYHGLQILYQLKLKTSNTKYLWIDLANQFVESKLAEARLRLRPRMCTPEEETKAHHEYIRKFFEGIEVNGYLDSILSYLYEGGSEPSFDIERDSNRPLVVIVSGIDILKNATPETHRNKLQIILDRVLTSLPDDPTTTIVWFDSPVPSVAKSIPYATRSLLPYYSSSSLAEFTTEIIWNLSSPPKSAVEPEKWRLASIGNSPIYDDIRLIVTHSPEKLEVQFESIPLLQGWSKRFKNQGRGLVFRERKVDDTLPEKELRDRMKLLSLTLIPWIVNLHPTIKSLVEPDTSLEEEFDKLMKEFKGIPADLTVSIETTENPPSRAPKTLDLLRFRQPDIRSGKAFIAMTIGRINSQRLYRSPLRLKTIPRLIQESSQVVEIASKKEKQIESEWSFGIKFLSEDSTLPWWMVMQDPQKDSRLLVGCFSNMLPKEGEFLWSETKKEILTSQTLDEILGLEQVVITFRTTEQGLEAWNIDPVSDDKASAGILEAMRQGYASVSHLRATRYTESNPTVAEPPSGIIFSERFYQRVTDALKRYLNAIATPIAV